MMNPGHPNPRRYLLAILSAFLLLVAAPGQWSLPAAVWFALVPLIIACRDISWRNAAWLAFCSGLAYYISLIYWIVFALNNYGGLSIWFAIPVLLLLSAYLASYLAAFAALLVQLRRWPLACRAPFIWVGLDLIKTHLFSGFPWQDLGYSQYQHPLLIQFADIAGHNGLTFLIIMTNAMLADIIMSRRDKSPTKWRRQLLPAALLALVLLYSLWSYRYWQKIVENAPVSDITLVQGNIDQAKKWQPGQEENTIDIYQRLSSIKLQTTRQDNRPGHAPDLIVWPETALPFFPFHNPLFNLVLQDLQVGGPTLITGAPHYEENTQDHKRQIHNSAFALTATTDGVRIQRYDKEHLVPFGEYVPFANLIGGLPLVQSMGNFSPGSSQKLINCGKASCGILICFESIFPDMARKWSDMGANLLLNLTNDAWYGRSSAPWQQLSMVTLRAVENRRSLARAANTGISVFVDPLGRLQKSPLFKEYAFRKQMPLITQKSFFTTGGYLFAPLCLLVVLLMLSISHNFRALLKFKWVN